MGQVAGHQGDGGSGFGVELLGKEGGERMRTFTPGHKSRWSRSVNRLINVRSRSPVTR